MNQTGNILLVEDDGALRTMLEGILETAGHPGLVAGCRGEALARLRENADITVVMLDLGLPPSPHDTREGMQCLRDIQREALPVKTIVLTGQDGESAALEAIREGAFDFLAKPASSQTILQSIGRALLFAGAERDLRADGFARLEISTRLEDGMKSAREWAEEKLVRQVLRDTGFNVYQSAKRLGIKRENVYYFLRKFGIQRDD